VILSIPPLAKGKFRRATLNQGGIRGLWPRQFFGRNSPNPSYPKRGDTLADLLIMAIVGVIAFDIKKPHPWILKDTVICAKREERMAAGSDGQE